MSCLQAENQGVKCACFLQHKIFTTYIIGIFCGCVSWRQLFYTIIIFCCSVWRCEKWDRCFYGCVWVWRDSSCVEQVPSLFYQNKCSPSQLTHDAHLSDVTVLPANQSELRSFSCAAMLQWEERGNPLSTLGCADAEFFYVGSSQCYLGVGWVQWHWPLFEEHWIDAKAIFLATKTLSSICIQKALLTRWCPELMSLNSF